GLHGILVRFAGADDAVVRPYRSARILQFHPLPLLDDVRVGLLDELAHSAERCPAPVAELGDSLRDQLRCRLAWARARLFHVLTLDMGFPSLEFNAQRRTVLHTPRAVAASRRTSSRRDQPCGPGGLRRAGGPAHRSKCATRRHPSRCNGGRCWSTASGACRHPWLRAATACRSHPSCTRAPWERRLASPLFRL